MRAFRILACVTVVLLVAFVPSPASAYLAEVKGFYWSTTPTLSNAGGQVANWSTPAYGGDFRLFFPPTPFGVHLQYVTGSQGSWGGLFAGGTGGTDTIYSGDVFYTWHFPGAPGVGSLLDLRTFAGYGRIQSSTTAPAVGQQTFTSNGFRVGVDVVVPFPATRWAFQGGVAYYPSNSTSLTSSAGAGSASAQAWDYTASVQYTDPRGWLIEGGYRWLSADTGSVGGVCPCTAKASGVFFAVGYRW